MAFIVLILLPIISWISSAVWLHFNTIPSKKVSKIRSVLTIFPHPDDEVLTSGGLMQQIHQSGGHSTVYFLTKGEKGTPNAELHESLKTIRENEAEKASQILKSALIIDDWGDGMLDDEKKKTALKNRITQVIQEVNPELIVTYDESGLYGHPDHISLSQLVTAVIRNSFPDIKLWYAAFPPRILRRFKLPEHMATNKYYSSHRLQPTHKVFIGFKLLNKIRAIYAHRSQYHSFRSGFPHWFMPVWLWVSLVGVYEYFYELKE